jgi:hypothetical protein
MTGIVYTFYVPLRYVYLYALYTIETGHWQRWDKVQSTPLKPATGRGGTRSKVHHTAGAVHAETGTIHEQSSTKLLFGLILD